MDRGGGQYEIRGVERRAEREGEKERERRKWDEGGTWAPYSPSGWLGLMGLIIIDDDACSHVVSSGIQDTLVVQVLPPFHRRVYRDGCRHGGMDG
jgi:hypothetical protein